MSHSKIRFVTLIGVICITSIITLQTFWFIKAHKSRALQLELQISLALKETADKIYEYNNLTSPSNHMINQVTNNYYVVMTNSTIEPMLLELWLLSAFKDKELDFDFEYGIYDCTSEKLVFSNRVENLKSEKPFEKNKLNLPDWAEDSHYFAVHFPKKNTEIFFEMGFWLASSILLIIIVSYFSYLIWMVFRQKKLSEMHRDFVNNMTHEFNTPLTTIDTALQLIHNSQVKPDKYLKIIKAESDKLKNQIARTLQISQMESGETGADFTKVHFCEFLEELTTRYKDRNPSAEITLLLGTDCKDDLVNIDEFHLENVMINLFDNALKYNQAKKKKITISLVYSIKHIKVCIEDNGIGIAEEEIKHIFKKFYRVNTGDIHDQKGFGLGLFYVAQVLKAIHGTISVESKSGIGSTFCITLPKSL